MTYPADTEALEIVVGDVTSAIDVICEERTLQLRVVDVVGLLQNLLHMDHCGHQLLVRLH